MRKFAFLLWPILTGILAAIVILKQFPNLFGQPGQLVEFIETATPLKRNNTLNEGPVSYASAFDNAAPAVVNIYSHKQITNTPNPLHQDPMMQRYYDHPSENNQRRIQSSLGSGVIVSPQGYIATNHHVIANADSIIVALQDGRESVANLVGTDPETDLAVLHVELNNLPSITLANSDSVKTGDVAFAIGNPYGVGQAMTMGIVSAVGRNSLGLNTYENFIQTDAAINPGNSGGALINARGELMGINTAIFTKSGSYQGLGFAIPSNIVKQVTQNMILYGRVIRGWLGIEAQELTHKLAESFNVQQTRGLIVAGVFNGSPAALAGVQAGDIISRINGQATFARREAMDQIARLKPGETVVLELLRNNERMTLSIEITERPKGNDS